MNNRIICLIGNILICCFLAGYISSASAASKSDDENMIVYRVGNKIFYDGPISAEGIMLVKNLYGDGAERLVINSRGGEINLGMELGEFVFDHQMDVEVTKYAFSSAANYVFAAGKNKYLHKTSMLGWHGGAMQNIKIEDIENGTGQAELAQYLKAAQVREKLFFAKIGVNQQSTTLGQRPEFDKYKDYVGWTYSLAALKKLGMSNIKLLDGVWNPPNKFAGKKIFTIDEAAINNFSENNLENNIEF